MARYRKRPVVIEAEQWHQNGDHSADDCGTFTDPATGETLKGEGHVVRYFRDPGVPSANVCNYCQQRMHWHDWIDTLEGGHIVCPGDWIITGVQGERYPIKDSIFRETYEPVDEATS